MKYIYKDGTYYFFKRKIPYTNKNYSFSLRTKNLKTAKLITGLFLREAESLFYILKSMSREEVLDIYQQMEQILNEYKDKALIEHKGSKDLEKKRMKDFKYTFYSDLHQKNITRDCSNDTVAQYWIAVLQDVIGGSSNQRKGLFKRIFKRSEIDPHFYKTLSTDEKEEFEFMLIKKERDILYTDRDRANGDDRKSKGTNISPADFYQGLQEEKNQAMRHKTLEELKTEYIDIRKTEVKDEKSIGKDKEVIAILQSISDKLYIIDFTEEEYQKTLDIILHLSPNNGKTAKLYDEYGNNYEALVERFKKDNFPRLGERTGWNKFRTLRTFLNYAIEEELLTKNPFQKRIYTKFNITRNLAPTKKRISFSSSELNRLFSISSWYQPKQVVKTLHKSPERFYIPLIAFFTGMRLNEIAALSKKDILYDEDNKIYYIDLIDVNVKNETSKRSVPLHKFLLNNLKFKNYIKMMENEERLFMNLTWNDENGYGHNLSKAFNQTKFKSEWINDERLNSKNYMLDFHSFRHTALSRLDEGGVKEAKINNISGHSQSTQSQKTYIAPKVKELHRYIHKLMFNDIDFTNLENAVKEFYKK
jgi:integrase